MNNGLANTGYSSASVRIAYPQTRAILADTHEWRTRKHGLFVRISTNSVHANTGYSLAYTRIDVLQTRTIRPHTHE